VTLRVHYHTNEPSLYMGQAMFDVSVWGELQRWSVRTVVLEVK
jgi:hypothetical protein